MNKKEKKKRERYVNHAKQLNAVNLSLVILTWTDWKTCSFGSFAGNISSITMHWKQSIQRSQTPFSADDDGDYAILTSLVVINFSINWDILAQKNKWRLLNLNNWEQPYYMLGFLILFFCLNLNQRWVFFFFENKKGADRHINQKPAGCSGFSKWIQHFSLFFFVQIVSRSERGNVHVHVHVGNSG